MTEPRAARLSLVARLETGLPLPGGLVDADRVSVVHGTREPKAVDDFVAIHADAVYRYALRLTRSRQRAEDLTQETLLRGWQRRSKPREPAAARVWLLRIATNVFRDELRVARPNEAMVEQVMADGSGVAVQIRLDQQECVERAMAALDELPERQRQVMHLITIEQLPHDAAAQVLGITAAAVKANLSLARRTMREKLKDIYDEFRGVRSR